MPLLAFFAAFFAVFFITILLRTVFTGVAWGLGWLWGFTSTVTKDSPLRAFLLFAGAVLVCVFVAHL